MEIELKEASLHKLEHGDLIVLQAEEPIEHPTHIKMVEGLNFLQNKIWEETGKRVNFLLCDSNISVKHFRTVSESVTKEE